MRFRLLMIGLFFCAVGCGDGAVQVSGKVTLDDKPLPNASVIFEPANGIGSHGTTDANGEYTLSLMTKDVKGALPGKHVVRITANEGGDVPKSDGNVMSIKKLVPDKYNSKSELSFDVPSGGSKSADFKLSSK